MDGLMHMDVATMNEIAERIRGMVAARRDSVEQLTGPASLESIAMMASSVGYAEACRDIMDLFRLALEQQPKGAVQ